MQNKSKHIVSEKELGNLLNQAFLNLDVEQSKNQEIMEIIANYKLTQSTGLWPKLKKTLLNKFNLITGIIAVSTTVILILLNTNQTINPVAKTTLPQPQAQTEIQYTEVQPGTPQQNPPSQKSTFVATDKNETSDAVSENPADPKIISPESPSLQALPLSAKPKIEDSAYVFPKLTAEEIKANNKRKEKMIRQLSKMSKDKYALIPMGSCIYKGQIISVQSFYMQKAEVTNMEYRTFLFDLLINNRKEEFLRAKPDHSQWIEKIPYSYFEPMANMYGWHPAYDDYPIVNIPRAGAEMYCIWLSVETNNYLSEEKRSLLNDLRIPTDLEWVYAACNKQNKPKYANGMDTLYVKGKSTVNYSGFYKDECSYMPDRDIYLPQKSKLKAHRDSIIQIMTLDGNMSTGYAKMYEPNSYGIYNLAGNVSEMVTVIDLKNTSKKGPGTKGGSWMSPEYFLRIDADDEFKDPNSPSPMIGFRPVMTAPKR